jgi:hypothetical protein
MVNAATMLVVGTRNPNARINRREVDVCFKELSSIINERK